MCLATKDELIHLHLTERMADTFHKCKILEQLKLDNLSQTTCVEFMQLLDLINIFLLRTMLKRIV